MLASPGQPQDGDDKVAQASHDAGAAGGEDLRTILVKVHVEDPVQAVFDPRWPRVTAES
jgi:hypothetical protein